GRGSRGHRGAPFHYHGGRPDPLAGRGAPDARVLRLLDAEGSVRQGGWRGAVEVAGPVRGAGAAGRHGRPRPSGRRARPGPDALDALEPSARGRVPGGRRGRSAGWGAGAPEVELEGHRGLVPVVPVTG